MRDVILRTLCALAIFLLLSSWRSLPGYQYAAHAAPQPGASTQSAASDKSPTQTAPLGVGLAQRGDTRLRVLGTEIATVRQSSTSAPAYRRLAVDLEYTNLRPATPYRVDLSKFTVLVDGGHYVYGPDRTDADASPSFATQHVFAPLEPVAGRLVFLIPERTGDLTLVHFTEAGPVALDLTPDLAPPAPESPLAAPAEARPLRAALYGAAPPGALPGEDGRYVVVDLALTLLADEPLTSAMYDTEGLVVLRDDSGRQYRPAPVWRSLERPLRKPELWAGQPTRGQVAFLIGDVEPPPKSLTLEIYGGQTPISFQLPDFALQASVLAGKKATVTLTSPPAVAAPPATVGPEKGTTKLSSPPPAPSTATPAKGTRAAPQDEKGPVTGFNIALAALGGKIESYTSQYDSGQWAATNLLDGFLFTPVLDRGGWTCRPCGWSSKGGEFPHEIILSFHRGREARVSAVVIDSATYTTAGEQKLDRVPKDVEIWVSTDTPTTGFTKVAGAELPRRAVEHRIAFTPVRAKYLKVVLLSNYGGGYTQAGEIKVIEARDGAPSIVADVPKNLALPQLGGALVRFTSQGGRDDVVHQLVDADTGTRGWRSEGGYLPQEFVFSFSGGGTALIDRIVLNPKTGHDPSTWPKVVAVSVSTESPLDGFEDVGRFTLGQRPVDQEFTVDRAARFLKLRILENFGAKFTSLGEVKIIEGTAGDYRSILTRAPEQAAAARGREARLDIDEARLLMEAEPNDTLAQANLLQLDRFTRGSINPLGEQDHFAIPLPDDRPLMLSLELIGRPNIRTSLALLDEGGNSLHRFDPSRAVAERKTFSWLVPKGDRALRVTEPPVSMVLIWDTSGSMKGRTEDLQGAVRAYLGHVRPTERLNLIRFSGKVEVLLPEFTSDPERLLAATEGKFLAKGGTALFDAIKKGIELLDGVAGNRAIVVMTDGADTQSRLKYPEFWALLEEKRIRLYTIGLGAGLRAYLPTIAATGERVLGHVATAMRGRFYFARTSEELAGIYRQIADELQSLSAYYLKPSLSRGPGKLSVVSTGELIAGIAAPRFELILDASGSMREKKRLIDERLKIDVAKDVMTRIIEELPAQSEVALRVYGHRVREYDQGDCEDSELLFRFQKVDKRRLTDAVRAIEVKAGTTPLAYSLVQAAKDLADTPGDKVIVLVTDGEEYCGGSPEEVAKTLVEHGMRLRVEVVGFALADEAVKREMERVAEVTGGRLHDARDAKGLRRAIREALAAPYDVLDAAGARVAGGAVNRGAIGLPEGIFTVAIRTADKPIEIANVRIVHNEVTKIALRKEGQQITQQVLGPAKPEEAVWAADIAAKPAQMRRTGTAAPAGGPERLAQLKEALAGLERELEAARANRPKRSSGAQVAADTRIRHAQRLLVQLGFDPGPVDGLWGGKTGRAVERFQAWYPPGGLAPSGKLDDPTYQALMEATARGLRFGTPARDPRFAPIERAMDDAMGEVLVDKVMDDFDRSLLRHLFASNPSRRASTRWVNPQTGKEFAATAEPAATSGGMRCRAIEVVVDPALRTRPVPLTACERGGKWDIERAGGTTAAKAHPWLFPSGKEPTTPHAVAPVPATAVPLSVDRHLKGLLFRRTPRGLLVLSIRETPDGLRVNDLITHINDRPASDPRAFVDAINLLRGSAAGDVKLMVERGGALVRFVVTN